MVFGWNTRTCHLPTTFSPQSALVRKRHFRPWPVSRDYRLQKPRAGAARRNQLDFKLAPFGMLDVNCDPSLPRPAATKRLECVISSATVQELQLLLDPAAVHCQLTTPENSERGSSRTDSSAGVVHKSTRVDQAEAVVLVKRETGLVPTPAAVARRTAVGAHPRSARCGRSSASLGESSGRGRIERSRASTPATVGEADEVPPKWLV